MNPGTGEVLRDYAVALDGMNPPPAVASTTLNGSGHKSTGIATLTGTMDSAGKAGQDLAPGASQDSLLLTPALQN